MALTSDTALIGAHFDEDPNGERAGAAYVFAWDGTAWSQQAKLAANDGEGGDEFGNSVALSSDTAVIGAPTDTNPNGTFAGSAYVFVRNGGQWTQQAKLTASDGNQFDHFGESVALSGDTALVGAPDHDTTAGDDVGAAYVFVRSGEEWTQQAKLTASDGDSGDQFAWAVALDGDTALLSADDEDPNGDHAGAAYVFRRSEGAWSQQAKLAAADGDSGDEFAESVALSQDTALVGAPEDEDPNGDQAGSAYVFERSGDSWSQQAKLVAADGDSGDHFGGSVALAAETALIGADDDEDPNGDHAGAAYVFERSGDTWDQAAKLAADDGNSGDQFGESVAVLGDTALVSAWFDDDPNGEKAGAAYIYQL